jgi:hypothetical protein
MRFHRAIKKYFWRRCRGGFFNIHQVPNHKSHLFTLTLFAIRLSFSSPPLHHLPLVFLSPTFTNLLVLFAFFLFAVFLAKICFCVPPCCLVVMPQREFYDVPYSNVLLEIEKSTKEYMTAQFEYNKYFTEELR